MAWLRDLVRQHRRAAAAIVGCLALGVAAGALSFLLQPDASGPLGPGDVTVDVSIGTSNSLLELPPLGRLRADSHRGPLGFEVRVDRIDLQHAGDLAGSLASGSDPAVQLRSEIEQDLEPLLRSIVWRSLVVALAAGVVAGLLLPRRRARYVAATVAGSVGFVGFAGALAFASFTPAAFDQPEFEGSLAAAPDILNTVQRHIDDVSVVESRLEALSVRLVELYASVEGTVPSTADVRILHVSDIHSNPVGIELVERTAERFEVDAIIDTGDLTSFGATFEEFTVRRVARIDVPYYVVPGNHDHPDIRRALLEAGVRVLDPGTVRVGGVKILGVGEPTFTADNRLSRRRLDRALELSAAEVRRLVDITEPDVVAVHNRRQLEGSLGRVAIGLAGHTHEASLTYEDGSAVVIAGSAGATGVGALAEARDLPYEMQMLQFEAGRLVAVDRMAFEGTDGAFRLERVLVDPDRITDYPDSRQVPFEAGPFAPLLRIGGPS